MLDVREDGSGGVLVAVKAVPGAKRDQVAGLLGTRLKVRVAAPPEDGRANRAICELLASTFGCRSKDVQVVHGLTSAEKTVRIAGVTPAEVLARIA